nr:integrase, catalytic region, zinc finger, CCHC-type, peptidase aspartic, catalytic [Tanacetum cinerariifolium]
MKTLSKMNQNSRNADPLAYIAKTTQSTSSPSQYVPPSPQYASALKQTPQLTNDAMLATMKQIVNLLSGFQKQFPPTNNQLRTSTNPTTQATIQAGKGMICYNYRDEGHVASQEMHQEEQLDSDVDSVIDDDDNTIPYHQYQLNNEVESVPTNVSSAIPDGISVITILDDLRSQLAGHIKTYKEKSPVSLKIQLSQHVESNKSLKTESEKLKTDKKALEESYLEELVCLRNANKVAIGLLQSHGQPTYTIPMLSKRPTFPTKDLHKTDLGHRNPHYLKTTQFNRSALYHGDVIVDPLHTPMRVHDSKETLVQAEVSKTKMLEKMKDVPDNVSYMPINYVKLNHHYETFMPQKELSREQLQGKDESIRKLKAQISNMKKVSTNLKLSTLKFQALEIENTLLKEELTAVRIKHDSLRDENVSIKKCYQDLYKSKASNSNKILNMEVNSPLPRKETVSLVKKTNVSINLSAGIKSIPEASKSKSKSEKKTHRNFPARSENVKRVETPLRNLNKKNHVDSSLSVKHTSFISKSVFVCKTCNECLVFGNHDKCVVKNLKYVNAKNTKIKNDVNVKQVWKATGKVFASVGSRWKPTGRKFTLGDTCPLTRITKPEVMPLEKSRSVSTSEPGNNVIVTHRFSKKPLTSYKCKDRKIKDTSTSSPPNVVRHAVNDPMTAIYMSTLVSDVSNSTASSIFQMQVVQIVLWYLDSGYSRHMTGDRSKLINYVEKFNGTVCFENDQFADIVGYGDYNIGDTIITQNHHMNIPANDAPTKQALDVAPPTRTNDQIFPSSKWVPIGKSNVYSMYKSLRGILSSRLLCQLDEQWFNLHKDILIEALDITLTNDNNPYVAPPSSDTVIEYVNTLGYASILRNMLAMFVNALYQPWRAILSMINLCLTASGLAESPSLDAELALTDSEIKSNNLVPKINTGDQDKGKAGPNPGNHDEGQARPNPGATDALNQQNLKQMDEEFTTTAYPNVQKNLKLPYEDQVILEEPTSSTRTLSSLQNLEKELSFTDQFFMKKQHEEEPGKTNAEAEVQLMVSVLIHQDMSSVPLMTTPAIDLIMLQSGSPLPTSTATTSTVMTTTTIPPPPPQPQQSSTDQTLLQCIGELEQHMANLLEYNLALEESDLPTADMKEILQQQMFEDKSYEAHEDHKKLYDALENSLECDYSDQLLSDLEEAHQKKRKRRNLPRTPSGSPPTQHHLHLLQQAHLVLQVHLSDDEDSRNDHLPKADSRKDWWKPLPEEETPATPEPA